MAGALLLYWMFELSVNSYEIALRKGSVVNIDIFEHQGIFLRQKGFLLIR